MKINLKEILNKHNNDIHIVKNYELYGDDVYVNGCALMLNYLKDGAKLLKKKYKEYDGYFEIEDLFGFEINDYLSYEDNLDIAKLFYDQLEILGESKFSKKYGEYIDISELKCYFEDDLIYNDEDLDKLSYIYNQEDDGDPLDYEDLEYFFEENPNKEDYKEDCYFDNGCENPADFALCDEITPKMDKKRLAMILSGTAIKFKDGYFNLSDVNSLFSYAASKKIKPVTSVDDFTVEDEIKSYMLNHNFLNKFELSDCLDKGYVVFDFESFYELFKEAGNFGSIEKSALDYLDDDHYVFPIDLVQNDNINSFNDFMKIALMGKDTQNMISCEYWDSSHYYCTFVRLDTINFKDILTIFDDMGDSIQSYGNFTNSGFKTFNDIYAIYFIYEEHVWGAFIGSL